MKIAPSLLAADYGKFATEAKRAERSGNWTSPVLLKTGLVALQSKDGIDAIRAEDGSNAWSYEDTGRRLGRNPSEPS